MNSDRQHLFPRNALYQIPSPRPVHQIREPGLSRTDKQTFSERHLHCVWSDPRFRPKTLYTTEGQKLYIEHPGHWNLEAGPDFRSSVLRLGPNRHRIIGDTEIHIHARDWQHHGHCGDPNFAKVKLHLTYYPGSVPADYLPPGTIQAALQPALAQKPTFSFEQVDITAYPYEIVGTPTPLREKICSLTPEEKQYFLDVAGEQRLQQKADMLSLLIQRKGTEQTFYEEFFGALGYKQNKQTFKTLAQAIPIQELRREAAGDPTMAYALLAGVSGLMPHGIHRMTNPINRAHLRWVWDIWWKKAETFEQRVISPTQWNLTHLRPANHPLRRMMAAAHLFTLEESLMNQLHALNPMPPRAWCRHALQLLDKNIHTSFHHQSSIHTANQPEAFNLIGRARAINILTNLFIPFSAARSGQDFFRSGVLEFLPCEAMNSITRQTAHAIFGRDHSTSLYRTGLRRQGLIHVFHNYGIEHREQSHERQRSTLLH